MTEPTKPHPSHELPKVEPPKAGQLPAQPPTGSAKPIEPPSGSTKPADKPADKPVDKKKEELAQKIRTILGQFNNQESNIPQNHEYWQLMNQYRGQ